MDLGFAIKWVVLKLLNTFHFFISLNVLEKSTIIIIKKKNLLTHSTKKKMHYNFSRSCNQRATWHKKKKKIQYPSYHFTPLHGFVQTDKADRSHQSTAAACGQELVNSRASATKAEHEMSQMKNSKFPSHSEERKNTTATPRYCLLVSTW